MCGNPAYAEMRFDPSKGVLAEQFNVPVADARSDTGVCGPEAILFEPQMLPVVIARGAYAGVRTVVLSITAALFAITMLYVLFGIKP